MFCTFFNKHMWLDLLLHETCYFIWFTAYISQIDNTMKDDVEYG